MNVITWDKDDAVENASFIDSALSVGLIINDLKGSRLIERENIRTNDALNICKMKLMGEYHGLLVRRDEEFLDDAEVYLLTWDGEASDGGEMIRIDYFSLIEIAKGTLFLNDK